MNSTFGRGQAKANVTKMFFSFLFSSRVVADDDGVLFARVLTFDDRQPLYIMERKKQNIKKNRLTDTSDENRKTTTQTLNMTGNPRNKFFH